MEPGPKMARRISAQLDYRREGKLYSRRSQEQVLLQAFRSAREDPVSADRLVLISGPAGIGKTALGSSIRGEVERCGGLLVQGKYGQVHGSNLREAVQSAFADFAIQMASQDKSVVQRVRDRILKTLKKEAAILVDVVPEMEKILGPQQHVSMEVGQGAQAQTSVNYVYRLLIKAIASREHPLIMLLDDLQWADQLSLQLFEHLLTDSTSEGVLFIGTLRDSPQMPHLLDFMEKLDSVGLRKQHIELQGLNRDHVVSLISDALQMEKQQIATFADFVYTRTGGNFYFLSELLRLIQDEDLLRFDEDTSQWTYDEHLMRVSVEMNSIRDLFRAKILDQSPQTQEILKVAACLGFTFDVPLLEAIFRDTDVSSCLNALAIQGLLVIDSAQLSCGFCHDSVQEAAYNLIREEDREVFHLNIGLNLLKLLSAEKVDIYIYVILDQIIRGETLLTNKQKRFSVAALCLKGGEKAFASSNFPLAATYLKQGISFCQNTPSPSEPVKGSSCWRDEYTLCLRLYEGAAEAAYCNGQSEEVDAFTKEVIENARSFDDTIRARGMQVYALGSVGRMEEAIDQALSILERLGEKLPARPTPFAVATSSVRTRRLLRGKSDELLLRIPLMTDEHKIAAMQILNLIFVYAFYVRPNLACIIAHRMVQLTVKDGMTGMSGVGFGFYSMILCGSGTNIEEGYRYGKLALRMNESLNTKQAWLCRLSAVVYGLTLTWKDSLESLEGPLQYAYQVGLSTGDTEFAFLNACLIIWDNQFRFKLPRLENDLRSLVERLDFYGQVFYAQLIKPVFQSVLNFMGQSNDPTVLCGEVMDQEVVLASADPSSPVVPWMRFQSAVLAYHFDDFETAAFRSAGLNALYDNAYGATDSSDVLFYETLALLRAKGSGRSKTRGVLKAARSRLKRLQKWARHSPENLLTKQFLIEAELALFTGDDLAASSKYLSAMLHARHGGFMLHEAYANERMGDFMLARGRAEQGQQRMQEARRLYSDWGSSAKVRHLEAKHSFLQAPGSS